MQPKIHAYFETHTHTHKHTQRKFRVDVVKMFMVRNLMSNHVFLGYYKVAKFQNIVANITGKLSCKTLAPFPKEEAGDHITHFKTLIKVVRQ